jgi:hypothetical protein
VTLDELALVATRDLAAETGRGLDPEAMLARLHRARRRRTAVVSVAAAAVLAVTVAGVGAAVGRDGATPTPRPPAASGKLATDDPCSAPRVTCLPGAKVRVALDDPVVLAALANFETMPSVFSRRDLQIYRTDTADGTGITVLEQATPMRNDESWTRDPSAGVTARSVATWLAHRPFLQQTTPERVRVGGRTAWRVPTVLRNGAALKATYSSAAVAPLFTSLTSRAYLTPSLPGEITVLGSPSGHGVIVIWSWTTSGQTWDLIGNEAMVAGLRFP